MCYVSLVGIMMCLKRHLNARSYVCVLAQCAASCSSLGEAGAWTKRGQSVEEPFVGVEKPFLGVEHPFRGVDKPWTSRRMPPQTEKHAS